MYRTGPPASPDETRQCSADKMTQIEVLAETLFYHAMSHRDLIEFGFFIVLSGKMHYSGHGVYCAIALQLVFLEYH